MRRQRRAKRRVLGVSQDPAASSTGARASRLPISEIVAYALPMARFSAATMTLSLYMWKSSADVLLVPAAAMGLIFMLGRVWDALTDPVAPRRTLRTAASQSDRSDTLAPSESGAYSSYPRRQLECPIPS